MRQRAQQVASGCQWQVIGQIAEFYIEIEDVFRYWPVDNPVAAKFGAGEIRNEQYIGSGRPRWPCWKSSVILNKNPESAAAEQFPGNGRYWFRPKSAATISRNIITWGPSAPSRPDVPDWR
jgi:hypothetical protein